MFQLSGTVALVLVTTLGSGDPEFGDAQLELDVAPGLDQVSIERSRWEALRALAEYEEPPPPLPKPWAATRDVELERRADGVRVRVRWAVKTLEPGWLQGPLIGPLPGMRIESARWRGRELGITATSAGDEIAVELERAGKGTLELVAFIPADRLPAGIDGELALWLMPAVRGELRLKGSSVPEDRVPELLADGAARRMVDGRFWAGEAELDLRWVAPAQAGDDAAEGPLAVAQSAVGLTFGDGEVRGRARVSWLLRQGQLDRLSIDTSGLGRDLELAGPNVLEWSRQGDRIDIVLKEPASGRVDVDLRWSEGLGSGDELQLSAPTLAPRDAYRSETFMQVARDGELEILPKLAGWAAVASVELPEWAGGYIEGTATASYRLEGGGGGSGARFELLRFVPLSGPPVMVDIAAYEVATTDEGRSLVQARYDVRNERASHLLASLPAGARMLGVRVNGEAVTPTRGEGGSTGSESWRIPLVRSLESVEGALSFPVEVIYISDERDWDKKEARELRLPALDAPVAVSRVRLYLPPRYQNRVDVGDFHRVDSFSEGEGITYGLGVGSGAETIAAADELYRDALSAWMSNDFDGAQSSLDELGSLGASNANIEGLQANLDLVQGRGDSGGEAAGGQSAVVSRRIKAQARQRAAQDEIDLREREEEAAKYEAQGDYDKAEAKLAEAQEIGERLVLLEQSESQEQVAYNQSLSLSSARIAEKKKRKKKRESKAKNKPAKKDGKADKDQYDPRQQQPDPDMVAMAGGDEATGVTVYDFEDDLIEGELLQPEGANIVITGNAGPTTTTTTESIALPLESPEEPIVLELEDARKLPVGSDTSRDFTAVVEVLPGAAPEPMPEPEPEPGVMLDPIEEERLYAFEDVSELEGDAFMEMERAPPAPDEAKAARPRRSRIGNRGGGRAGGGKRGKKGKASKANAAAPTDAPAPAGPPPPPADPNAALAGPVVTASAVTVHIPAIGEAVLYQYMLLPEGEALSVHLEARRNKRDRN